MPGWQLDIPARHLSLDAKGAFLAVEKSGPEKEPKHRAKLQWNSRTGGGSVGETVVGALQCERW